MKFKKFIISVFRIYFIASQTNQYSSRYDSFFWTPRLKGKADAQKTYESYVHFNIKKNFENPKTDPRKIFQKGRKIKRKLQIYTYDQNKDYHTSNFTKLLNFNILALKCILNH
jgi:hypothetical protein